MMDNYIERDYLQYRILEECESPNLTKEADEMLSTIYGLVINAPSCNAEPVIHAHWLTSMEKFEKNWFVMDRCSNCSWLKPMLVEGDEISFNYCPNCGAKMDEEVK